MLVVYLETILLLQGGVLPFPFPPIRHRMGRKEATPVEDREALEEQLTTADQSVFFLILIILSILLSFWSVLIQREQLGRAIAGTPEEAEEAPDVFPIRAAASALIVTALGFFFCLAIRTRAAAQGEGPAARASADRNLWASLLVLAAALIRLFDLNAARGTQTGAEEEEALQPD